MDLKCLFWNVGGANVEAELPALIASTEANFVALAEYYEETSALLRALSDRGLIFFSIPVLGCERIKLFVSFEPDAIEFSREADRYTIRNVKLPGKIPLLVGVVHLRSKLHAGDLTQAFGAQFFKNDIEEAEQDVGHANTVIFGDFNMNPFDHGMMAAAALNSLPCLKTAQRGKRKLEGRNHSFFYNPSWNLLGDFRGSPGTFFLNAPEQRSDYWNLLDQMILRPSIADRLDKQSLRVVLRAGEIDLLKKNGRPAVSDHLPIFFSLNIGVEI